MSDDFIPLNQSTPVHNKRQDKNQQQFQNIWQQKNHRHRGHNQKRWSHNSQNGSFGSDCNSSYGREDKTTIDAYLHPSMLKDPWAHLKQKMQ